MFFRICPEGKLHCTSRMGMHCRGTFIRSLRNYHMKCPNRFFFAPDSWRGNAKSPLFFGGGFTACALQKYKYTREVLHGEIRELYARRLLFSNAFFGFFFFFFFFLICLLEGKCFMHESPLKETKQCGTAAYPLKPLQRKNVFSPYSRADFGIYIYY